MSERNPVFHDAEFLIDGMLFRRSALRARLLARSGRGGLRNLNYLRLFIGPVDLIGPLRSAIRRFAALAQEVNVAGVDFKASPRIAIAVGVLFEAQPPLNVNLPALRQVFVGYLGLASPSRHAKPECVLLRFAPGVPALFGRGDGEVANGRPLRRVVE